MSSHGCRVSRGVEELEGALDEGVKVRQEGVAYDALAVAEVDLGSGSGVGVDSVCRSGVGVHYYAKEREGTRGSGTNLGSVGELVS